MRVSFQHILISLGILVAIFLASPLSAQGFDPPTLSTPQSSVVFDEEFTVAVDFTGSNFFSLVPDDAEPLVDVVLCGSQENIPTCVRSSIQSAIGGVTRMYNLASADLSGYENSSLSLSFQGLPAGNYRAVVGLGWSLPNGDIEGPGTPPLNSSEFTVEASPEIEILSPLRGTVLQPGNEYTFAWKWGQGTYPFGQRGWNYSVSQNSNSVRKISDGEIDNALNGWFNQVLIDQPNPQDDGVNVDGDSFTFIVPYPGSGEVGGNSFVSGDRSFTIRIRTRLEEPDEDGSTDGPIVFESLLVGISSLPGDVDQDGFVGHEDLFLVSQFIRDVDSSVQRDDSYQTSFALYNVDGEGVVDVDDLWFILENYTPGR